MILLLTNHGLSLLLAYLIEPLYLLTLLALDLDHGIHHLLLVDAGRHLINGILHEVVQLDLVYVREGIQVKTLRLKVTLRVFVENMDLVELLIGQEVIVEPEIQVVPIFSR